MLSNARLTLVLGGARSGKSRHAEQIVTRLPPPWVYIATAEPFDDEMRARIAAHRAGRPEGWTTVEAPRQIVAALDRAADTPVLVDCLTLWLTNVLLSGATDASAPLLEALRRRKGPTVLVANEVGLGIVPDNALARRFRDEAGALHQRIAALADEVLFMVAGLPMVVKA